MDKRRSGTGDASDPRGEIWFNGLFDRYYTTVRNFAFQMLGDMEAAQEVAQEVFVKLWMKGVRDEMEPAVRAFLFTATRNLCIDSIRTNRMISEFRRKIILKYTEIVDPFIDDFITSDLYRMLEREIAALPPQCALTFRMSRVEHLKYREIADRLGISVKAVEANVSRAIAILREKMGGELLLAPILFLLGAE